MAETIREKILANIKTTLEGISIANGYNNDIAGVERWKQHGNSLREVPCIIINGGPEDKEAGPNPLVSCKFTAYLDIWIRQDKEDVNPTDSILNSLLGDVEKAMMVDCTRGGDAKDTNILSNTPFETVEGAPHAGLIVEVEIIYRHYQNDPEHSG